VTTFQVLTGENWNEVMYLCIQQTGYGAVIYFVSEVIIGTYVVLNLFLAILIDHFTELSEKRDIAKMEAMAREASLLDAAVDASPVKTAAPVGFAGATVAAAHADSFHQAPRQSQPPRFGSSLSLGAELPSREPRLPLSASCHSLKSAGSFADRRNAARQSRRMIMATRMKAMNEYKARLHQYTAHAHRIPRCCGLRCDRFQEHDSFHNKSLYVLKSWKPWVCLMPWTTVGACRLAFLLTCGAADLCSSIHSGCVVGSHSVRFAVGNTVLHPIFEGFITFLIAVACVGLALDSAEASPELVAALWVLNIVLTVLFTLEMVLKMFAFGVWKGPGTYMRDPWNLLDLFIVLISLLDIFLEGTLRFIKVLRFLRALRPLRAVKRLHGLRVVINAVAKAFPGAMNVALVCLLFFFLYGILGVNFFSGKLRHCTDPSRVCSPELAGLACTAELACNGTFIPAGSTTPQPREWVNPSFVDGRGEYSFDNSLWALMTLFEVASLELWQEVMYRAVDIKQEGWGPEKNANQIAVFFFMCFIMFGSMFIINLFVSVVVDNFRKMKQQEAGGSVFMTAAQQQWVDMQGIISRMRPAPLAAPPASSHGCRLSTFRLVSHPRFDIFIMSCIVLNVLVMCTQHAGMSHGWETLGAVSNYVFGGIFLVEMVVKHIGLGVRQYWASKWNMFDGTLVVINVVTVLLRETMGQTLGVDFQLFRVFRVFRIFRLVKTVPQLRLIFTTLRLSLPSMANVGTLLILMFFMCVSFPWATGCGCSVVLWPCPD